MTPTPRLLRRHALVALCVPLALAAAACGGGDDDLSAIDQARSAASQASDQAADAQASVDSLLDGMSDSTDFTIPDMSDVTLPENVTLPQGVDVSDDCRELYNKFATAVGGATAGEGFGGLEDVFNQLADSVPADLEDDVHVLADAYGKLADLVAPYNGDFGKAMADPKVQEQLASISSPEFEQASNNLSQYFEQTCPELQS
jgi:hypothetical protein